MKIISAIALCCLLVLMPAMPALTCQGRAQSCLMVQSAPQTAVFSQETGTSSDRLPGTLRSSTRQFFWANWFSSASLKKCSRIFLANSLAPGLKSSIFSRYFPLRL